jgi:hypothetical protein
MMDNVLLCSPCLRYGKVWGHRRLGMQFGIERFDALKQGTRLFKRRELL